MAKRQPLVREFQEPKEEKIITRDSNFLPVEGIPTDYKLYPEGTTIYARPLTVKEVRFISTMNESNYSFVINEILKATVKGIEIDELYSADKLYILFWLRANSYKNEGYNSEYSCVHCGTKNSYLFTMDKLNVITLEGKDFDPNKPIKLLNSDDVVTISFPKIKDENKVLHMLKQSKNTTIALDEEILSLASMVTSINEQAMSLKYVYDYINNMNVEDYAFLKSYIEDNEIGVSSVVKTNCKNESCQEENLIEVRFQPEFFLPKYQHRTDS